MPQAPRLYRIICRCPILIRPRSFMENFSAIKAGASREPRDITLTVGQ